MTRLDLRVMPRAPRNAIEGWRDQRLVVRVTAPPVDGAANAAVVALLSERLELPKRMVRVIGGETARNKTVEVDLPADEVWRRLSAILEHRA